MKIFLSILPVLFLVACQKPIDAPELEAVPDSFINATVHTLPNSHDVIFEGKVVGQAPVKLKISSLDQLTDNLSAGSSPDGTVEQRIRHLTSDEVVVTLILDKSLSKMATALDLKKILVFDYGDEITFEYGKSDIKPAFRTLLQKQAELLNRHFKGIDLHICGHADSKGRAERNSEISMERARAVYDVMAGFGVTRASMKVHGFGSEYPLDDNSTEAGRARNRRTEIILGR